jgi:hypothetical protein
MVRRLRATFMSDSLPVDRYQLTCRPAVIALSRMKEPNPPLCETTATGPSLGRSISTGIANVAATLRWPL